MSAEKKIMWKDAVWPVSRYYIDIRLKGLKKTVKNLRHNGRCTGQDSNLNLNQLSLFSVNSLLYEHITSRSRDSLFNGCAGQLHRVGSDWLWMMNWEWNFYSIIHYIASEFSCTSRIKNSYTATFCLGELTGLHWTLIQSNFTGQHGYVLLRTRARTSIWRPATSTDDFRCLPQVLQAIAASFSSLPSWLFNNHSIIRRYNRSYLQCS